MLQVGHGERKKHQLQSSFRGRKLIGTVISLPTDVRGVVLQENFSIGNSESDQDPTIQKRRFDQVASFETITHWDRDGAQVSNQLQASLQWIKLARGVRMFNVFMLLLPFGQRTYFVDVNCLKKMLAKPKRLV